MVVYDKSRVKTRDVDSYEKLAAPAVKGLFCVRSGSHPYNLSLFGSMLEHLGPQRTEDWLKGLVANMARQPKGGDTDQIKAVAAGECGVALTNSYYVARLLRSTKPEDKAVMEKVGLVFPNQSSWGTHVNVAGAAVARHARNREAAVRFLEYLASDSAQRYFADGNNEFPVVKGVAPHAVLTSMGSFKSRGGPHRQGGREHRTGATDAGSRRLQVDRFRSTSMATSGWSASSRPAVSNTRRSTTSSSESVICRVRSAWPIASRT
jgi:iron(III) transport system substrate-binding protein